MRNLSCLGFEVEWILRHSENKFDALNVIGNIHTRYLSNELIKFVNLLKECEK